MKGRSHNEAMAASFKKKPELAKFILDNAIKDGDREELLGTLRIMALAFDGQTLAEMLDAVMRSEDAIKPSKPDSSECDAAKTRKIIGMSQSEFASLLGVSVRTLQGWEQGRHEPTGAARTLLAVAAKHPEALLDSLQR